MSFQCGFVLYYFLSGDRVSFQRFFQRFFVLYYVLSGNWGSLQRLCVLRYVLGGDRESFQRVFGLYSVLSGGRESFHVSASSCSTTSPAATESPPRVASRCTTS